MKSLSPIFFIRLTSDKFLILSKLNFFLLDTLIFLFNTKVFTFGFSFGVFIGAISEEIIFFSSLISLSDSIKALSCWGFFVLFDKFCFLKKLSLCSKV